MRRRVPPAEVTSKKGKKKEEVGGCCRTVIARRTDPREGGGGAMNVLAKMSRHNAQRPRRLKTVSRKQKGQHKSDIWPVMPFTRGVPSHNEYSVEQWNPWNLGTLERFHRSRLYVSC